MKTNLEKPKKVSKQEISPKEVLASDAKKLPSLRTYKSSPKKKGMVFVSEKGPSQAKPRGTRKKLEKEPIVSSVPLDMIPLDERTDLDHTKKSLVKPYWKTPENIPVENDFTESFDHMTLQDIMESPDEEGEFLMQEFGTKDPETIERITAERLQAGDYEKVVIGNTEGITGKEFKSAPKTGRYESYIPESKYRNFTEGIVRMDEMNSDVYETEESSDPFVMFSSAQPTHQQRDEKIHGNPKREYSGGHDNLKTWPESKQERASRGILNKIKNFWLELKNDTKSIAEELGWDEEAELSKQAAQYQAHLKETEKNIGEIHKEIKEAKDYDDWEKAA